MALRRLPTILILAISLAAAIGAVAAGPADETTYYIFASSNRTPVLTDNVARSKLSSFEETNAIAVADRVACALGSAAEISSLLRVYNTSAENSFLIESKLSRAQAEYLAALMGSYERHRYVLLFSAGTEGQDRLWTFKTARGFEILAAEVRKQHMTPLSVRLEGSTQQIWMVDLDGRLGERLKQLAVELGVDASSENGSAELLGDKRNFASAEAVYGRTIQRFEQQSSLRISSSLAGGAWRKALARTCSRESPQ